MSLDISLTAIRPTQVYESNITHNLAKMADHAGLYTYIWHPENIPAKKASELILPLRTGLQIMREKAEFLKTLNPINGWGNYENLLQFVEQYLEACIQNPDAEISAHG